MDEGNLPVGHIQRVEVAPWDEISKERLGLAASRPVADDDSGAAEGADTRVNAGRGVKKEKENKEEQNESEKKNEK